MSGYDQDELEAALRDMLAERSRRAPAAGPVAARVLDEVDSRPVTRRDRSRRWTWVSPIVAAGAVAAVAITVVAVNGNKHSADHVNPVAPGSTTPAPSPVIPPPATATQTQSGRPKANPALSGFVPLDVTFGSATDAWMLGTGKTCSGPPHYGCDAAVIHSTDGGKTWSTLPTPPAHVVGSKGCYTSCVTNIRFANATDGYLFGLNTLYLTHDGGRTWQLQQGGAEAIETLDNNVIRVSTGCLPGCPVTVQTSAIGSTTWVTRTLPGSYPGVGDLLVRAGSDAYILDMGHTSGGANNATSVLFSSTDDGATWTNRGEPCPQTGGGLANDEVDSTAVAVAADGTVLVQCTPRGALHSFVVRSTDHGGNWQRAGAEVSATGGIFVAVANNILFAQSDVMYRSTDGGATWAADPDFTNVSVIWAGFESDRDGRMVVDTQDQGVQIWTTHDAGAHWSISSLG